MGASSPSLDGDLDTQDRRVMGWSYLCLGYKRGVCFQDTQLGALIHESSMFRCGLSPAYHLLESNTGAYIEWLVNEHMRLLIKIEYKDARLVMLPADAINPQAR